MCKKHILSSCLPHAQSAGIFNYMETKVPMWNEQNFKCIILGPKYHIGPYLSRVLIGIKNTSYVIFHLILLYLSQNRKCSNIWKNKKKPQFPPKDKGHMDSGTRQRIKALAAIPSSSTSQKSCLKIKVGLP